MRAMRACGALVLAFTVISVNATPAPLPAPDLSQRQFRLGPDLVEPPSVIGITAAGKLYVGGTFTSVDGQSRPGVARLNGDGTLDTTWAPALPDSLPGPRLAAEDGSGNVALVHALPSGDPNKEALVYVSAGTQSGAIVATQPQRSFHSLAFDPAGNLFVGDSYHCHGSGAQYDSAIYKYTGGTTLDPGFSFSRSSYPHYKFQYYHPCIAAMLADGAYLYVARGAGLERVSLATGDTDASWGPLPPDYFHSSYVGNMPNAYLALAKGADGWLYVAGTFFGGGFTNLARVSMVANAADSSWVPAGFHSPTAIGLDAGAIEVYVAGYFGEGDGASRRGLAAFSTSAGAALDPGWDPNAYLVSHLRVLADRVLVGGQFSTVGTTARKNAAALPLANAPVAGPLMRVTPASLDFGFSLAGEERTRTFAIHNDGTSDLAVGAITFATPSMPVGQTNTCATPLPPGGSCTVTVTIFVSARSAFQTSVTVEWDGSPRLVTLFGGFGTGYAFQGDPNIGPMMVGTTATRDIVLTNQSGGPMTINAIDLAFPTGSELSATGCVGALAAGANCTITITFAPQTYGSRGAVLSIDADVSGPQLTVLTQSGLTSDDYDGDGIPNAVEEAGCCDPFVKDNDLFANRFLFVQQQYRDFLGREGDASGVDYWSSRLDDCGSTFTCRPPPLTRGQLIEQFLASPEFEGAIAPVARLYFAYFLRVPDYGGIRFWIEHYRAGNSLESISEFFASSTEFAGRYGALDHGQFVDLVYQNVLGRAPDPGGRAFWTAELDSGRRTRGQVMLGFSESAEYRALIAHEVYVTMIYIGMLRRAPDPGGFAFWVGYLDGGQPGLALIDGVLYSPEYRSRFLP